MDLAEVAAGKDDYSNEGCAVGVGGGVSGELCEVDELFEIGLRGFVVHSWGEHRGVNGLDAGAWWLS